MTILYKKVNLLLSKNVKKKKLISLSPEGKLLKVSADIGKKIIFFLKIKVNFFLSDEKIDLY